MTLRELARQATKKYPFDIERASAWMLSEIKKDSDLLKSLLDPMLKMAIRETIYDVRHDRRTVVKCLHRGEVAPTRRNGNVIHSAISGAIAASILDTWIINDRRLGDVFGKELPALASDDHERADGFNRNAQFYSELAKFTPPEKRVRQAVDAKTAESIWRKIKSTSDHIRGVAQKKCVAAAM